VEGGHRAVGQGAVHVGDVPGGLGHGSERD
jgi:hypothetical protein